VLGLVELEVADGVVQAIRAVVNPTSSITSDRCLMWRDCRRRIGCRSARGW
jgi:hypothetical protein